MALSADTLKLLGLSEGATDEEIEAAINKMNPSTNDDPPKNNDNNDDNDDLSKQLSAATAQILELQKKQATGEATSMVDAEIANGKLLPAQRETAIKMAIRDAEEFKAFIASQPNVIEMRERGSSSNDVKDGTYTQFEPTEAEVAQAKQMGVWNADYRIQLMRTKASAKGVELPADFGKEKENEKDKNNAA